MEQECKYYALLYIIRKLATDFLQLKKPIQGLQHPPNTTEQLIAAVCDAWDTLPITDVNKHVNGMGDCVDAIIAAKGGHMRF